MSLIGLLWVVLIALKIAGIGAMAGASWLVVIFWPLVPIILFLLFMVFMAALSN